MSDSITLILEPDNPCNTIITHDSEIIYVVETKHTNKRSTTYVKNCDGNVLASSEWRDVRSDIITVGDGKPVPSSAWLKKSWVPFKDTIHFEDVSGKKFKWKGNGPGLSLELYSSDDKTHPVARFIKSRRIWNRKASPPVQEYTPAQIRLDSRGMEMRDMVVVSWLFLEKSRRARENSTMNHADGSGVPFGSSRDGVVNGGV